MSRRGLTKRLPFICGHYERLPLYYLKGNAMSFQRSLLIHGIELSIYCNPNPKGVLLTTISILGVVGNSMTVYVLVKVSEIIHVQEYILAC